MPKLTDVMVAVTYFIQVKGLSNSEHVNLNQMQARVLLDNYSEINHTIQTNLYCFKGVMNWLFTFLFGFCIQIH